MSHVNYTRKFHLKFKTIGLRGGGGGHMIYSYVTMYDYSHVCVYVCVIILKLMRLRDTHSYTGPYLIVCVIFKYLQDFGFAHTHILFNDVK